MLKRWIQSSTWKRGAVTSSNGGNIRYIASVDIRHFRKPQCREMATSALRRSLGPLWMVALEISILQA